MIKGKDNKTMRTNKQIEDFGYVYMSESADESVCRIGDVRVYDKHNVFFVDFDAVLQSFDVENRNHRYYLADNVWNAINTPKIQALIADNAWYGEMNHPTQETQNAKLTPERIRDAWLPNRSHKIMRPRIKGNLLEAHIQTASGTAAGTGFAKEIIQGLVPRFSCRSVATLKNINGRPTVIIKVLITYDWVVYPSHKEAGLIGTVKPVLESGAITTESVHDITPEDTIIPLNEILQLVGTTDPNTEILMESFDLSFEDIIGVTKDHSHVIMCDKDNTIYAKVSPKTKHKVDDFFASF